MHSMQSADRCLGLSHGLKTILCPPQMNGKSWKGNERKKNRETLHSARWFWWFWWLCRNRTHLQLGCICKVLKHYLLQLVHLAALATKSLPEQSCVVNCVNCESKENQKWSKAIAARSEHPLFFHSLRPEVAMQIMQLKGWYLQGICHSARDLAEDVAVMTSFWSCMK